MNNQTLVIYDFDTLYQILKEIDNYLNFKLINVDKNKLDQRNLFNMDNIIVLAIIGSAAFFILMLMLSNSLKQKCPSCGKSEDNK